MNKKTAILVGVLSASVAAGVAGLGLIVNKERKKKEILSGLYLLEFDSLNLIGTDTYTINLEGQILLIDSEMASKMEVAEVYLISYSLNKKDGYDGEVISIELK